MTEGPSDPDDPTDTPTDTATDYETGVAKLERELAFARRNGALAVKQMHAMLAKELRQTERELEKATARAAKQRQRADDAKRRARLAEDELAAVKESATWKAGRAVVGLPSRIRRLGSQVTRVLLATFALMPDGEPAGELRGLGAGRPRHRRRAGCGGTTRPSTGRPPTSSPCARPGTTSVAVRSSSTGPAPPSG